MICSSPQMVLCCISISEDGVAGMLQGAFAQRGTIKTFAQ